MRNRRSRKGNCEKRTRRRSPFCTLTNCRTACGHRRRRRPTKGVAPPSDQLAALAASDERASEDLAGATRRLLGGGRCCVGGAGWEAFDSPTARQRWRATCEVAVLQKGCCDAGNWQSHRRNGRQRRWRQRRRLRVCWWNERGWPMCHRPADQGE